MRKILLGVFTSIILLAVAIPCNAADIAEKNNMPIVIINNSIPEDKTSKDKGFAELKHDLPEMLLNQTKKSLETKYCTIELKNDQHINDIASTEKSDLIVTLKNTNYQTAIFAEILPVQFDGGLWGGILSSYSDTVTIHLKIIDITNQKYLYNGKISSSASTSRRAMPDINKQLDKILTQTLMQ